MTDIPADVMQAARDAASLIGKAHSRFREAVRRGEHDTIFPLPQIAAAIMAERERCAKWHDVQISRIEAQIMENNEYAAKHREGCSTANTYCLDLINCHRLSAGAIRKGDPA